MHTVWSLFSTENHQELESNYQLSHFRISCESNVPFTLALLKAQVSLQLGKVFSSDNGVSVSTMYSYMY